MARITIVAVLLITSYGQGAGRGLVALIEGYSCGAWTAAVQSSAHAAHHPDILLAGITDLAGMGIWLDNYCRAHPLDKIADAVHQLVLELRMKHGR
ncbi:MAG TPA: hypothetical protein VIB38_07925 [Aestuariivirgaceae bacterium]